MAPPHTTLSSSSDYIIVTTVGGAARRDHPAYPRGLVNEGLLARHKHAERVCRGSAVRGELPRLGSSRVAVR